MVSVSEGLVLFRIGSRLRRLNGGWRGPRTPESPHVEDDVIDLSAGERVPPRGHEGGQAHAGAPSAHGIAEIGIRLPGLKSRVGQIPGPGVEVEGVEAVPRSSLAVADLTVVLVDTLPQAQLVGRSSVLRGGARRLRVPAARDEACEALEQESNDLLRPHCPPPADPPPAGRAVWR